MTQADDAREASEAKYKAIFDSVNDAIFIHDPDTGAILEVNRKMTEMFGYTADEALTITVGDISSGIPPYTQQGAVEKMKSALEQGEILFEWHCKDKSGRLFWVEVNLKPTGFGDKPRIIATARDITIRKNAEEALAQSRGQAELERKHLEAILEANPSAVALIEVSTGRLSYMNRRAMDLYGVDYTGFDLDAHLARVRALRPDGAPYPMAEMPFSHSLKGEEVHNEEMIIERADGVQLPVLVSSAPLFDAGGRVATVVVVFDDITHRKMVEDSLRESEGKYRSLFESSIDGILISDPDGGIYAANPAACRILGRTEEEIIGEGRDNLAVTDDPRLKACLEERERTGSIRCELMQKRKDGTTFPVEISSSLMKDRQGNTRASVIFRDISERKENEQKIRRLNEELEGKVHDRTVALSKAVARLEGQREILQTIIDHIPVIVTLCSPKRELQLANKEFERLTGWTLDEAGAADVALACFFPDPSRRKEPLDLVAKADPGWRELDITARSGEVLRITWADVGLSDGSRIGIGIDVTELRRMEQDLLKLATAIDQAGEGVVMFSSEWCVEYVNPAYERLSGYTKEELIGRDVAFLNRNTVSPLDPEIPHLAASRGKTWSGSIRRKKKNGDAVDIHLTVSPVRNGAGEIINYVSVVQDITQETRLNQMVVQNQKMEAIGSLAGGIAHDLKNILTPILINTEVALEDVGDNHPARPALEDVLGAARMGRDLVQQVLTFSRRTSQNKVPVNISSVIRETMAFLRSTLPSSIDVRNELHDECVMAIADPTQIKQVLINLGSNAGYAMKEQGGVLDVSESSTTLDVQQASEISPGLAPGTYIQLTVHDTGQGMDENTMEHIFEPFFTTKRGEGTGMGLAMAHGIVKNHQGAITVRSIPGKGSTFRVFLPMLQGVPEKDQCRSV